MSLETFIANRLVWNNAAGLSASKGTRVVVGIAIGAIALSMSVMIIALGIITGFREEIRNKISGFGAHIQVTAFNFENPLYSAPISSRQAFPVQLMEINGVKNVQAYALKEGIIKAEDELQGVLTKGVGPDFDWEFFERNLQEGKRLETTGEERSNGIIVSRTLCSLLNKQLGDAVFIYYVQEGKSRPRKFEITGIYETGMAMMDNNYVLADIRHVQKLNNWDDTLVSGFEVLLTDYTALDKLAYHIYSAIPPALNTTTIKEQHPEIFGWLELQDMNIVVILLLMTAVAAINVISALLILILDKTTMIGMLKALGSTDKRIRRTFILMGAYLAALGLLIGNAIGLGLGILQQRAHIISLPKESYYMEYVPFELPIGQWLMLNFAALFVCVVVLILPVQIISNISPARAMRID